MQVQSGTIDVREVGISRVEDEGEVGAGEDDGIESFAADESLGESGKVPVLVAVSRGFSGAGQFDIGVVDEVDLGRSRRDNFNLA